MNHLISHPKNGEPVPHPQYQALIDQVGDHFFLCDVEGHILEANRTACQLLGYTHQELQALGIYDIDLTLLPHSLGELLPYLQTGAVLNIESSHRCKDGSVFPVELRIGLFESEIAGEQLSAFVLCRDISERKKTEELKLKFTEELRQARDEAIQATKLKSAFLASISHELRTPLNAIIGYAELLKEELALSPHTEDLDKICHSALLLLQLINDVLDISKIEAGKIELQAAPFSLEELLEEAIDLMQPALEKQGNQFSCTYPPQPDLFVGDKTRISQCLLNLLSNANKFTTEGKIQLQVTVEQRENSTWVSFRVEDTGIGIEEKDLQRIFQPFQQANPGTWKTFGGTGLGLAITKTFCEMMKGQIQVESRRHQGSVFLLELPLPKYQDPLETSL